MQDGGGDAAAVEPAGQLVGEQHVGQCGLVGHDDHGCDRDDQFFESALDDLQPLDRGQHRDRRGDHAVAEEQRGAEETDRGQHPRDSSSAGTTAAQQGDQSQDAASPWLSVRITSRRRSA
jgi:hypothetical protein